MRAAPWLARSTFEPDDKGKARAALCSSQIEMKEIARAAMKVVSSLVFAATSFFLAKRPAPAIPRCAVRAGPENGFNL
jgi:hypothetical protein